MATQPDWVTLRIFLAALDLGSVTRAADRCGIVTSAAGRLPARFAESWVLAQEGNSRQARLRVRVPRADTIKSFTAAHEAELEIRSLNLEQLFPLLVNERNPAA